MGSVRLYGATSGYVELAAPDVADNSTFNIGERYAAPGLALVRKVSFAGAASVPIDSVFTAAYRNYRIVVVAASNQASGTVMNMRLRASGADVSSASYYWNKNTTTTTNTATRGNSATAADVGLFSNTDNYSIAVIDLARPVNRPTVSVVSQFSGYDSTGYVNGNAAFLTSNLTFDGFTLYPAAGTVTGDIYVYGYSETVGDGSQLAAPPGLALVTTQAFSTVSSVSVNGCFTSAYRMYRVAVDIASVSADTSAYVRLRSAGSDDSSSTYNYAGGKVNTSPLEAIFGSSTATAWWLGDIDSTTGDECMASLDLSAPALAIRTHGIGLYLGNNASGQTHGEYFGLSHRTATAYDGFTLYPGTGTFTGTLSVYGYRN